MIAFSQGLLRKRLRSHDIFWCGPPILVGRGHVVFKKAATSYEQFGPVFTCFVQNTSNFVFEILKMAEKMQKDVNFCKRKLYVL